MNFDTNTQSLDSIVLMYKQNQFDQAEAGCSRFLQDNPNNASALYLFGLILQKQGKNDLAIDYINKAISTDAAQIASFQTKLLDPVQQHPPCQMQSQPMQPQTQSTDDDDPFKATRELLKRFEQEQAGAQQPQTISSSPQQPAINQEPFNVNQKTFANTFQQPQQPQQPFAQQSFSQPQPQQPQAQPSFNLGTPIFQQAAEVNNSALLPFIQQLYAENFSAQVLLWTDVESSTIGNLNQFPGMKFSIYHDEIKDHEYYTEILKNLKLRSMSVVTLEKVNEVEWDLLVLPYTAINCSEDPIGNVSYKTLYLANGFMNAPSRQLLEETLKSKGCSQKGNQANVFERKAEISSNDNISKGEQLFESGKVEESIKVFEDILANNPNNTDAYNNLGVISYGLGNAGSAEKFLLKALEINPNHTNALMNLADVYCASGHLDEAAKYLTKGIELEPKNYEMWACLSNFYKKIGSHDEAQAAHQKSELLKNSA